MKILLTVLSLCLGISFGYYLSCPDVSQWSIRARLLCPDPSKYYCLWDGNAKVFKENCSKVDLTRAGERLVIQYNFDSKFCPKDVYQPYIHFTNESSGCIYKKSLCNEDGQVVYDDTDTKRDIKCTCDYTRGYDFITRPNNQCYCIPSEEDCSCYLNPCMMPALESDSRCTNTTKLLNQNNCAPIKNSSEEFADTDDTRPLMRNDEQAMETVSELDRLNVQTAIVFVGCITAIIMIIGLSVIIVHMFKVRNDTTLNQNFPKDLKLKVEEMETKMSEVIQDVKLKVEEMETKVSEVIPANIQDMDLKLEFAQAVFTDTQAAGSIKRARDISEEEMRIVFVGKTKVGKSSTANTILGRDCFPTGVDFNSVTQKCQVAHTEYRGRKVQLIDTPGIFAEGDNENETKEEILRCIHIAAPGPHAILFVMEYGNFRQEDAKAITTFLDYFGEEFKLFVIVVFTHVDRMGKDETIEEKIKNVKTLNEFLDKCGHRYCKFNNVGSRNEKESSIAHLFTLVETMIIYNSVEENVKQVERESCEDCGRKQGPKYHGRGGQHTMADQTCEFLYRRSKFHEDRSA